MIATTSLHVGSHVCYGEKTWLNKVEYANRHGYLAFAKTVNFRNINAGFEKIFFLQEMMYNSSNIEWIHWTGSDTLYMNHNIKLESIIDNNYHFIICADRNVIMNADSFLIRNTPEGRAYIDAIAESYPRFMNHYWVENQSMLEHYEIFKGITKILPQRTMNSYDYSLYGGSSIDQTGNDGNYQPGDFLIHWPGTSVEARLGLYDYYIERVIK